MGESCQKQNSVLWVLANILCPYLGTYRYLVLALVLAISGTLGVRAYPCIGDGHMPILCSYLGTHGYIQQLYSNDGNRDGDVGAQMIIDKDTQHQLEKTLLAMHLVEYNLKHSFQKLAVEGSVHSTFCAEDIQVI